MKRSFVLAGIVLLTSAAPTFGQGDPEIVDRIIEIGKTENQVWDHLMYLSDEIGTRLTGSARLEEANEWTRDQFDAWGLSNAHLQKWGEISLRFDRGPSYARIVEPIERELEFTTPAWTLGTDGPVKGPVFKLPKTVEDLDAIRDKLDGAWILTTGRQGRNRRGVVPPGSTPEVAEEINQALAEAGIAGRIIANRDELVRTFASRRWNQVRSLSMDEVEEGGVTVYIRRSDYDVINSRLADGEDVTLEIDLQNKFTEGPFPLYNTIAEIPGTEFPDEVVIVSAHLDSWDGPGSKGTQDNGTGTSVTLEAARLLMEAGAKPRRTIRFILWTGEEQGLLGSRAYVESLSEEERAKISAVLVDDGGTNYEGGLVCVEAMAPMLREATAPVSKAFPRMPVEIDVRERMPRFGGSDHHSFNEVGIPGFFWDEKGSGGREGKNYRFIHHTQNDIPRYAVPEYLVQSSTCAAVTAYNLASADTLLPRATDGDDTDKAEPAEAATVESSTTDGQAGDTPFKAVASPVSGRWVATLEGGTDRGVTLHILIASDGRVGGKTSSGMGEAKIIRGTFNQDTGKLQFVAQHEQYGELMYDATFNEEKDTLAGTLSVGENFSMKFTAARASKDDQNADD